MISSTPTPFFTCANTNGPLPRIFIVSRSITFKSAPTALARSVVLITSKSDWVMPGPPLRGILSLTATFKVTEVKFGKGKMLDVKRPVHMIERITGDDQMLDRKKLKVDSDKAIETALKEKLLDKLTITATQLWLQRAGSGGVGDAVGNDPVWKVRILAAKLRKPEDADIGDVFISAETGKVLKTDLHINSVD